MNDDWIGDDGELPPRKSKPIEGVSVRTLSVIVAITAVIAASIGAGAALLFESMLAPSAVSNSNERLVRSIDTLRTTQVALDLSLRFLSNQIASVPPVVRPAAATRTPRPTALPPDQCYCDNASCRPPSMVMRRDESLDSLGIQSSDPSKFGWYLVRNVNEISGVYFEVYPAEHRFVCDAPWDMCQFSGYYTTRECVLSTRADVCDGDPNCRFSEPLSE
jgi:hypothetical protein